MPEISCRGILFDLDGVLINSTPAVTRVWSRWAVVHDLDPARVVEHAHGRPSITTIREFLPHADHKAEDREVERREIEDLEGVVALPGARELVDSLPSGTWTIVTSATRPLAEVRLQAAGLRVPQQMITADDVNNGKPNPEPYLKGAALLGFKPEECVVVEDVPAGIRAAKSAGALVIALRTTVGDQELRLSGPDWVLDNCGDISAVASARSNGGFRLALRED